MVLPQFLEGGRKKRNSCYDVTKKVCNSFPENETRWSLWCCCCQWWLITNQCIRVRPPIISLLIRVAYFLVRKEKIIRPLVRDILNKSYFIDFSIIILEKIWNISVRQTLVDFNWNRFLYSRTSIQHYTYIYICVHSFGLYVQIYILYRKKSIRVYIHLWYTRTFGTDMQI